MVSVFFVRVGSQISPRRAKKDSNIPSPGRTRSVKCPTPGPTKTIKSPPHALPSLPPPRRHTLDRCITECTSKMTSFIRDNLTNLHAKCKVKNEKKTFPIVTSLESNGKLVKIQKVVPSAIHSSDFFLTCFVSSRRHIHASTQATGTQIVRAKMSHLGPVYMEWGTPV